MPTRLISSFFALLILISSVSISHAQVLRDFEGDPNTSADDRLVNPDSRRSGVMPDPSDSANSVWRQAEHDVFAGFDAVSYLRHELTFGPTGNNNARIEVDFYADEGSRSDAYEMQLGIGSYHDTSPDNADDFAALLGIRFDTEKGYHFVVQQLDSTIDIDVRWVPKAWYNVAFELDTVSQTFEIFLDDVKLSYDSDADGSPDSSTFSFQNYSLDLYTFGVISPSFSSDFDEFLYLDNITLNDFPNPTLPGDVNLDGEVTFLDINPFIGVLESGGSQAEADCNLDGLVNFLDIAAFIGILAGN